MTKGELFSINFLFLTQSPHVKKRQHVNIKQQLGLRHENTPSLYNTIPCLQSNVRVCSQNSSKFTSQWAGTVPAVRLVNEIPPGFQIFRLCRGDGILLILLFLLLSAWSETRKGQNQL